MFSPFFNFLAGNQARRGEKLIFFSKKKFGHADLLYCRGWGMKMLKDMDQTWRLVCPKVGFRVFYSIIIRENFPLRALIFNFPILHVESLFVCVVYIFLKHEGSWAIKSSKTWLSSFFFLSISKEKQKKGLWVLFWASYLDVDIIMM